MRTYTCFSFVASKVPGPILSEAEKHTVTLEAMDGIVSDQSLEALLQWLYLKRVRFDCSDPQDQMSVIIELARLADMCEVIDIQPQLLQDAKNLINSWYSEPPTVLANVSLLLSTSICQ